MRIVNREEFLKLPSGTMYAKYEPCVIGELEIKWRTVAGVDFYCQSLIDIYAGDSDRWVKKFAEMEKGTEYPIELDSVYRDGLLDQDQLFMVLDIDDVKALHTLIGSLIDARS